MARALNRESRFLIRSLAPSSRLLYLRGRSGRSEKVAEIFEVELGEDDARSGSTAARRLDDVIHGIVVRRAAPDWLPFIPGSSYWVPPPRKRSRGLAEMLARVSSSSISEEDFMSFRSLRGWPSPSHLKDLAPDPLDKNLKDATVQSEDED